jgi:hypothetical protein
MKTHENTEKHAKHIKTSSSTHLCIWLPTACPAAPTAAATTTCLHWTPFAYDASRMVATHPLRWQRACLACRLGKDSLDATVELMAATIPQNAKALLYGHQDNRLPKKQLAPPTSHRAAFAIHFRCGGSSSTAPAVTAAAVAAAPHGHSCHHQPAPPAHPTRAPLRSHVTPGTVLNFSTSLTCLAGACTSAAWWEL